MRFGAVRLAVSTAIALCGDSVRQRATHKNIEVALDRYLTKPARLARFGQGAIDHESMASVISDPGANR
jgi:hypothetical protein